MQCLPYQQCSLTSLAKREFLSSIDVFQANLRVLLTAGCDQCGGQQGSDGHCGGESRLGAITHRLPCSVSVERACMSQLNVHACHHVQL